MTQRDTELDGNTKSSNSKGKTRCRNWFFTFFHENPEEVIDLTQYFDDATFQMQEEKCEKTGKLHIQGVVLFENARYFNSLHNDWPKIHWEKCRNKKAAIDYCKKKETATGKRWSQGFPEELEPALREMNKWQHSLWTKLQEKPNNRKITWIIDIEGAKGKTTLCKHICMSNKRALYCGGKAADIKYAVTEMVNKGMAPKICLFDFPRSMENFVSYQAIEEIKNGIFFNGKYESGMVMFNSPHVACFSNFEPDMEKLSKDRWEIIRLNNEDCELHNS